MKNTAGGEIRTRFAPSPTGMLHAGAIRTALFAWLIAKQFGGQFIIRIEDTDKNREVEGALDHILESLKWLGISWAEGPDVGGKYGPYLQSERLETYKECALKLIDKGFAYADPYTPAEVEAFREQAKESGKPFLFRNHRPEQPPTWDDTRPLRFKVPELKSYQWHDEVRGNLSAGPEALDDFIMIKADGFPTYNFAHVVDDHLMEISHVVRGEEFIASQPKFLALYEAFDWSTPKFVTLPPVLNKQGGKKLSKREDAQSILEYRDQGYLPEGVVNFLASLGWNDGTEQEVYTPSEIEQKFSIDRIQKSGAKFDDERLIWLNGHHIRHLGLDELFKRTQGFWSETARSFDDDYKKNVLGLVQERLKYFGELKELTRFFFEEPELDDGWLPDKVEPTNAKQWLTNAMTTLENSDFSESDLETKLRSLADEQDVKAGILFGVIRVAVTGQTVAPGLFETLHVLGQDRVEQRLSYALSKLS